LIVDCHTHVGLADVHVRGEIMADLMRAWSRPLWHVPLEEHWAAVQGVERAIVLAFDAPDIGVEVPNEYVADYVRQHPEKLIGFASVDPKRPQAPAILERAVTRLGLRGLKIAPIYQHFDPWSTASIELLEAANALRIPVLWHQETTFVRDSPLNLARPALLDEIARRFPELPKRRLTRARRRRGCQPPGGARGSGRSRGAAGLACPVPDAPG
jgi:hypothetical protein